MSVLKYKVIVVKCLGVGFFQRFKFVDRINNCQMVVDFVQSTKCPEKI